MNDDLQLRRSPHNFGSEHLGSTPTAVVLSMKLMRNVQFLRHRGRDCETNGEHQVRSHPPADHVILSAATIALCSRDQASHRRCGCSVVPARAHCRLTGLSGLISNATMSLIWSIVSTPLVPKRGIREQGVPAFEL